MSGLSPVAALRLATNTSAGTLGLPDRGTIEAGKAADLLPSKATQRKAERPVAGDAHILRDGALAR